MVSRHQDRAYTLAVSIVKDHMRAQDVLQEAFIKAYRGLRRFRERAGFATWLHTIVVRASLDERKRHKTSDRIDMLSNVQVMDVPASDDAIHADESRLYINRALDLLKPDEALAIRLFYLAEFSVKEVQRATGFSPAKIRVDLHRGRKHLRGQLDQFLGDETKDLL